MNLNLRQKLLLVLLLSTTLSLVIAGSLFDNLIHRFNDEHAQDRFQEFFRDATLELHSREQRLIHAVNELAQRNDIVAASNMLHHYGNDPFASAEAFDGERIHLAGELSKVARAGEVSQLALYDGDGVLVAFFCQGDPAIEGYQSRLDNALSTSVRPVSGAWEPGSVPASLANTTDPARIGLAQVRQHRGTEGFVIEYSRPIVRPFPDGSTETVGYLLGAQAIGQDFIDHISQHARMAAALLFADGQRTGELEQATFATLADAPLLTEGHRQSRAGDYLVGVARSSLGGDESVLLVAGLPTALLDGKLTQLQVVVISVLLLSALMIIPVGTLLARRAITEPVERLVAAAEAVQRGEFGQAVPVSRADELGRLAAAFNQMSVTLAGREASLVESENRYRTLVDNLPLSVFFKDTDSVYRSCNRHYVEDRGLTLDTIIGRTDFDFYPPDLAERYRAADRALMAAGEVREFEEPNIQHGRQRIVHTTKTPVWDASGQVIGVLGIYWDVTERRLTEDRLRQAAAVLESTAEGVVITDANRVVVTVNKAFSEITGYGAERVVGYRIQMLRNERQDARFFRNLWREVMRRGRWQGEVLSRRKNGEVHPTWMTISAVRDEQGRITNYAAVFSDITALKHSQAQLDHLAHHDPLTGLPNRLLLNARLTHAIEHARRHQSKLAVLFLDLDRFKVVNDTLGHPVGDQLLQAVALRLRERLRECDTVARLGGDEFVVTMDQFEHSGEVTVVAQKLLDVIAEPFQIGSNELHLGVSIGIALYPQDGDDVATLVKNADAAMYLSKEQGRNTYHYYTDALGNETEARFRLEMGLRQAVEREALDLYYQPQVDLVTGRVTGAEALLRWRTPDGEYIGPERFIPLAEETGLILPIGEWLLRRACQQFTAWREAGLLLDRIAINLSGVQVQRGEIATVVQKALAESGMVPSHLELEITESVVMKHPEQAVGVLDSLRALGVELAIDDFGTGYSSLSYLKRFPIDTLKIDKSFVRDVPQDSNDSAIVQAVIALSESLLLRVTAEGIESEAQRQFLVANGCRHGQGYLFAQPLPADQFEAYVRQTLARKAAGNG